VDDDDDYRFLLQQLWDRLFPTYPVRFFPSGQALLEELPQISRLPSLILLDRHMPDLDGHQTLVALKQHPLYQLIPVVMMSADASPIEIEGCYKAGVNSFLVKPIGVDSLKEVISIVSQYWLVINRRSTSE